MTAANVSRKKRSTGNVFAKWPEGRVANWLLWFDGAEPNWSVEAPRRRIIALNVDRNDRIATIKGYNPNCKVVFYKDLGSTRDYDVTGGVDNRYTAGGVPYVYADVNHPEWFLTNAGGRMEWDGFGGHWQMDYGSATYQQEWIARARRELYAYPWDGVFMDNAIFYATAYNSPPPTAYPTDAAMRAAVRSMLAAVGSALNADGYLTLANISEGRLLSGLWNDYCQYTSATEEAFVSWGGSGTDPDLWDYPNGWKEQLNDIVDAANRGRVATSITVGAANLNSVRYAIATLLLGNDGRCSMSVDRTAWVSPEMTWDVGAATGAYTSPEANIYQRNFAAGVVILNGRDTGSASYGTAAPSETWTGTNGAAWPSPWVTSGGFGSIVDIQSNKGRMVSPNVTYDGVRAWYGEATNLDVTFVASVPNPVAENYIDFIWRGDDWAGASMNAANGYQLELDLLSGNFFMYSTVANARTTLATVSKTYTGGVDVNVRVQSTGNIHKAKVWNVGTGEPGAWAISVTNSAHPARGKWGLGFASGNTNTSMTFDTLTETVNEHALGGTYLDHSGTPVTSVTVAPRRAVILRAP